MNGPFIPAELKFRENTAIVSMITVQLGQQEVM